MLTHDGVVLAKLEFLGGIPRVLLNNIEVTGICGAYQLYEDRSGLRHVSASCVQVYLRRRNIKVIARLSSHFGKK